MWCFCFQLDNPKGGRLDYDYFRYHQSTAGSPTYYHAKEVGKYYSVTTWESDMQSVKPGLYEAVPNVFGYTMYTKEKKRNKRNSSSGPLR